MSRQPKRLAIERQCPKCPWKKSTNPHEIPHGYSIALHKGLRSTIATPGSLVCGPAMACHESKPGEEGYCVGWLMHQLGPGNNVGLRWNMRGYDLARVRLAGEQHERFEDTLPEEAP